MGRLEAGFVLTPQPFNPRKITQINLDPQKVTCLVFWTKNPKPLLPFLPRIDALGYQYFFEFTLTPYGLDLEPNLPAKEELIDVFIELSQRLGPLKMDWRYDPIIIDAKRPLSYHLDNLGRLGEKLAPYASRLIISFVDEYKRAKVFQSPKLEEMVELAAGLGAIANSLNLPAQTCAEAIDLSPYGITKGACLEREKIAAIIGGEINLKKDPGQRKACLCAESVDLGVYNTCSHLCAYCYATKSPKTAAQNAAAHNPKWPSLTGKTPLGGEITRVIG
jgi:hypothetical protein